LDHDELGEVLSTDVSNEAALGIDHTHKAGCTLKHGKHAVQARRLLYLWHLLHEVRDQRRTTTLG
jgi:hypothetical protein